MEQSDLLKLTVERLQQLGIPYAIVGSFASSVWGESRLTQDIDIVVDLKPDMVNALCSAFPDDEFYVSVSAAWEAVSRGSQFNVIHPRTGNKIDFMIAGPSAWFRAQLERSKVVPMFPDRNAHVAAPEDVILGKLLYYREGASEKHLRDIAGVIRLSGDLLDRNYVERFAAQLGVSDLWNAVLKAAEEP